MVSRLRPSHEGGKFLLKLGQYLCLLLALVCLGSIVLDYARARIFQSYQSWRFDRFLGHKPPSQISMLMGWIDHTLASFMKAPVARLNQDRSQSNAPASADHGSMAAAHALPRGALLGRMEIPKLGISVMVLEGDGDDVLRKAVGHVPTTALPGGPGNVVIAGHRDTFFRALRRIRKDDDIIFTTTQGIYNYHVGSIEKVGPQDVQVLDASPQPTLTLVTCYPFDYIGPAPERFVVQATETQSPEIGGPDHSLASVRLTLDSHSGVRSTSFPRRNKAHHPSSRPPSDSSSTRIATNMAGSTPVMDGPESASESPPTHGATTLIGSTPAMAGSKSTEDTTEAQQDDPPAEAPPTSHKVFGKVRRWLGSIPRHLPHGHG